MVHTIHTKSCSSPCYEGHLDAERRYAKRRAGIVAPDTYLNYRPRKEIEKEIMKANRATGYNPKGMKEALSEYPMKALIDEARDWNIDVTASKGRKDKRKGAKLI